MTLYSFAFFVFFFFVFVLFWKLPKKYQWIFLLLASYSFYSSVKPGYLLLVLFTTLSSYFAALGIHSLHKRKKFILILAILINITTLFLFKYLNFFNITINQLAQLHLPQFELLLPLGISFYTLQTIGYLIDVYRKKTLPEKHLGIFALFVSFFPIITSGPIERSTTLLPQLKKKHVFDYSKVSTGAKLFLFGMFKKMVIADNLGLVVDRVFLSLHDYKGLSLLLIIFFFTWQIYMDFSGYTDMARGVGKMLGIDLLENFNLPYLSTSVQNFWRRWHISFSSWLRDYIYFPLGGNRKGLIRTVINTLIVFLISGLWHGASWTFILWGVLHGIAISFERISKNLFGNAGKIPYLLQVIYAYIIISIFWVFFRSPTLADAFYVLKNSLVGLKNIFSIGYISATINQLFIFDKLEAIITFSLVGIAIFLEILQSKVSLLTFLQKQPVIIRFVTYIILLFLIIQLRNAYIKEFIYTRF